MLDFETTNVILKYGRYTYTKGGEYSNPSGQARPLEGLLKGYNKKTQKGAHS